MNDLHQYQIDGTPKIRNWEQLMTPIRLASIQPSALSGTRSLIDKMVREKWQILLDRFELNNDQSGTAVYSIKTPSNEFNFIAFSFPPKKEGRTGRIISQVWDMRCALEEGRATEESIETARSELPKLYRGRASKNTLIWGRANRSFRVFDSVLESLIKGQQPKISDLNSVCYLMRNTGLDGNGTFGTKSFFSLGSEHPLGNVLEADFLTAYMMREFSFDLIERLAKMKSTKSTILSPEVRRYIGVGNGSGLGLIFFVQRHPMLINSWITAREMAITKAFQLSLTKGNKKILRLLDLTKRVMLFRDEDVMNYESFTSSKVIAKQIQSTIPLIEELFHSGTLNGHRYKWPLEYIAKILLNHSAPETYETFISLIIELVKDRIVGLKQNMVKTNEIWLDSTATLMDIAKQLETEYQWALGVNIEDEKENTYIWYKSESAEEPRRGPRGEIPSAYDLGLNFPTDLQLLLRDIQKQNMNMRVSRFLLIHPEHRFLIARVQTYRSTHFHTPHVNCNSTTFAPTDLLRMVNVGFHGLDKTRDFFQRNLRGVLYHGAPTRQDVIKGLGFDWFYPKEPK